MLNVIVLLLSIQSIGSQRIRHDWVTHFHFQLNSAINTGLWKGNGKFEPIYLIYLYMRKTKKCLVTTSVGD